MALQSSTNLRCMNMTIMPTEQLQPHLDMEKKGRRTIKVCSLQSGRCCIYKTGQKRRGKKVAMLHFSLPPVWGTFTRDQRPPNELVPARGGTWQRYPGGICADVNNRNAANPANPNLLFFQSLTILTNMRMRFAATQPHPGTWKRKQMLKAEVLQL